MEKISKALKMHRLTECSGKENEREGGAKYNGLGHKLKVRLEQTSRQIKLVQTAALTRRMNTKQLSLLRYKYHILSRRRTSSPTHNDDMMMSHHHHHIIIIIDD
jgi:hypothetical protein